MKAPVVLVVCNALDDRTRLERGIETDSPAASRKVFLMCRALRDAGSRPYILSQGRGRASGKTELYRARVRLVEGVPTTYAPFSHIHGVSELLSVVGLLGVVWRLSRCPKRAVVFYNRMPSYLLTLIWAKWLGYRCILDLEDGEVPSGSPPGRGPGSRPRRWLAKLFDCICRDGALLACSALQQMTSIRPVQSYYGTAIRSAQEPSRLEASTVNCLLGGSLAAETGAPLLVDAISRLREQRIAWAEQLVIEVTGKGPTLVDLKALAADPRPPIVRVHGRTTDLEYAQILARVDVGLALKPIGGALADTTFPSKVVEFAAAGILVLTTDISDVRTVLGRDGAFYLTSNSVENLVAQLERAVCNRAEALASARAGQAAVLTKCAPAHAGAKLSRFILG